MIAAALVAAGLAFVAALAALARAAGVRARLEEAERDARRRFDAVGQDARREIDTLKQLVAVMAEGGRLTREQVLEGRTWSDATPEVGLRMVAAGDLRIVDVRTPQETAGGIIPGAVLIPIDDLEARASELPRDGVSTLVYCAGGGRSAAACEFLSSKGYTSLFNLEGGFGAWQGPRVRP